MATIAVRVKPGAARPRVGGRYDGPHGPALIVAVTAPPVGGRATEATLRALAAALRIKPSTLAVRTGTTSRDKVISVIDAPPDLAERVARLRDAP
jgi:uncharacterized protein YggU (UPF0235/DUF167 family)